MNIKGLEKLRDYGLPIMRNTFLFRNLSEIPKEHLEIYGDHPKWAVRGFDYRNSSIFDHPYMNREAKPRHRVIKQDIKKAFDEISKELDIKSIKLEERIYLVAEVFTKDDVKFIGTAFRSDNYIYIDLLNGTRSPGEGLKPDYSFQIELFGDKPNLSSLIDFKEKNSLIRVSKDLMTLPENSCVEFAQLKDGYLLYHDMYIVKPFNYVSGFRDSFQTSN